MHNIIKFVKNNALLIAIIFIGFFLRTINIDKPGGLWFDEAVSFISSQKSFPFGIIKFCMTSDLQPPIYSLFLHLWTKFFGTEDTVLRMMSVLSGVATIPVVYYTASVLATKRAGLIAAMLVSVNSLLIVYSQEVRVYSLVAFFAALSIMFLSKILKDSENTKNYIGYIISNLFLIYTSSFGLVFVGIQSIIYLFYLLIDKKPAKNYFKAQCATFLFSIPYIFMLLSTFSILSKSLVSFFDWARFKPEVILYVFQDWFSPVLINIYNYPLGYLNNLLHSGRLIIIIFLILFPVFLCITGFIKSLKTKENMILATIFASFFSFQVLMTVLGKMALVSRYPIICLPLLLVLVAIGLSDYNREQFSKRTKGFVQTYFIISFLFICLLGNSAPRIQRPETLKAPFVALSKYNFNNKDLVIMPYGGNYCDKYNDKNIKVLDFDILSTFLIGKKEYLSRIFDEKFINSLTIKNSKELFKDYIFSDKYPLIFENYFRKQVFSPLQKGEKVAIIISRSFNSYTKDDLRFISYNSNIYYQQSLLFMLSSKMSIDMLQVANKYLKPIGYKKNGVWDIYVYEKQ